MGTPALRPSAALRTALEIGLVAPLVLSQTSNPIGLRAPFGHLDAAVELAEHPGCGLWAVAHRRGQALPRAGPATSATVGHYRLRYDVTDPLGKMSFRRAGRMHHLGTGATNARKRVLAIADDTTITVVDLATGEVLSTHTIEPDKSYWRNTQKAPCRWPRASR